MKDNVKIERLRKDVDRLVIDLERLAELIVKLSEAVLDQGDKMVEIYAIIEQLQKIEIERKK